MGNKQGKSKFHNPFFRQENEDLACGVCGWKPRWLQRCNNMKVFMLCYVILGIFHGINASYFGTMLPSIEKRFGFSSESVGIVKSMNDISQFLTGLFIAHYGGSGTAHRPRWVAAGSFVVGLGFLLTATPEVFFPVSKTSTLFAVMASSTDAEEQLCSANRTANISMETDCSAKASHTENIGPLIIFSLAEFLVGLGGTATMILGLPFVDDQVSRLNSPIFFAFSFLGRVFGPLIGLGLGAVFSSIFFNFSRPEFKQTDPRWISAWYLGFIVSGLGTCLFSLTIACFPATIPEVRKSDSDEQDAKKTANPIKRKPVLKPVVLKDLPRNLKRLAMNYTYVVKLFSQIINAFVLSGYMSFSKKFMKEQYQLSQSTVSLVGGIPPVLTGLVGIGLGSFLIKRFKFRPVQVAYLMILSSVAGAICNFSVIAMGCDIQHVVGVDDVPDPYNLSSSDLCINSKACNCDGHRFSPVCNRAEMVTYLSPCIAGCLSSKRSNNTKSYTGCSCVGNSTTHQRDINLPVFPAWRRFPSRIVPGLCPHSCPNFIWYVVAMCIAKLCMGMPTAGVLMLQFRIVDIDLKSLANAVTLMLMSALGFLPAPIIIGHLIDSACRLWGISPCGEKGACWLYNADDFRWKLHAAVGIVRLISCLLDTIIAYRVRHLSFDREPDNQLQAAQNPVIREEPGKVTSEIQLKDIQRTT